jgi:hypothetical protein
MPSTLHEVLVDMFHNRPSLAVDLLTDGLGMEVPTFQRAEVKAVEFTDLTPTEYRADAVVELTHNDQKVLAVVVEVQLRSDNEKHWSWPVYLSTLRARARCPAVLLVVCVDAATANWCARPIDLGHPGWALTPLTVGPERVPVVTDVDTATRTPELACLSAIAHASHPERDKVLDAYLDCLAFLDPHRRALYSDFVYNALPVAARECLEALLSTRPYEYQSEFVRKYIFQGRAEGEAIGEARALLAVLKTRRLTVPENIRVRIIECTDADLLETLVCRAVTANSVEDLFEEMQRS